MKKGLIIVESPTKARTLSRYLGNDFAVKASVGHIKDLPKKELGVDIENEFTPKYVVIHGKGKVIKELKKAAQNAEEIYLAPDPDREGEAIAWHIAEELKKAKGGPRRFRRVLFKELTKKGIQEAMAHPVELDPNKYASQKARRVLDRLVGYEVSPLLWQKVKSGLSAGRVQSVALRLICEREKEIRSFRPEEYWTIDAHLRKPHSSPPFKARLQQYKGEKLKISDEKRAKAISKDLEGCRFEVSSVTKRETKRNPPPPFITSTLQQEASRRLHFPAKKTMQIAQRLYEGVDIGEKGPVGLITYMRTDSTRVSDEAVKAARSFITTKFGQDYVEKGTRRFKKGKLAQDAHEAIRPTLVDLAPEKVKHYLSPDEFNLYELIWKRFMASQMSPALFEQTRVKVKAGDYLLGVTGTRMKFPGFTILYKEGQEEAEGEQLPNLEAGDVLDVVKIEPKQHFTQPPPRYTEASLIKALEEKGIGRPSTYATILSNIRQRDYVRMEKRHFVPTELGMIVTDLLIKHFPELFDTGFTAQMEEKLDEIESGKVTYLNLLRDFYGAFSKSLLRARKEMRSLKAQGLETGLKCPRCNAPLVIRYGRSGEFIACSRYPDCTFSSDFVRDEKGEIKLLKKEIVGIRECPRCGRPMVLKRGRYGEFLACSGYPGCETTMPVPTGVKCPEADCDGELVKKYSRSGKLFYGCNRFPECKFAIWDEPVAKACPKCGGKIMAKRDNYLKCINKSCGEKIPLTST